MRVERIEKLQSTHHVFEHVSQLAHASAVVVPSVSNGLEEALTCLRLCHCVLPVSTLCSRHRDTI